MQMFANVYNECYTEAIMFGCANIYGTITMLAVTKLRGCTIFLHSLLANIYKCQKMFNRANFWNVNTLQKNRMLWKTGFINNFFGTTEHLLSLLARFRHSRSTAMLQIPQSFAQNFYLNYVSSQLLCLWQPTNQFYEKKTMHLSEIDLKPTDVLWKNIFFLKMEWLKAAIRISHSNWSWQVPGLVL